MSKDSSWRRTHEARIEDAFQRAWETNESGIAYLTFTEQLPERLKGCGLVEGEVKLSQYVFYKLIGKHKLSEEELLSVKEAICNPVAILRENNKVIVVTDIVSYQKFPITVVLAANKKDNCVASIYGRGNIVNYVYKHALNNEVLFADLDKIDCIRGNRLDEGVNERLDEIKRQILESRGCKLKMTIERDGKKIELTETEIWAAYSLVNKNITSEVEQEAEKILNQELSDEEERIR